MLDGISLFAIKKQLSNWLINSKVINLFQIDKYKVIIEIKPQKRLMPSYLKNDTNNVFLHLSINPSSPEIYVTGSVKTDLIINSAFIANLQNHIKGGKIVAITQPNFDRIICFTIKPFIRFGEIEKKMLIIEFMGKHGNIILVNEKGTIEHGLKLISSEMNRFREISPGIAYVAPPSKNKINPLNVNKTLFFSLLDMHKKENLKLWEVLQISFYGISRQSATEIVLQANLSPEKRLEHATVEVMSQLWISFNKIFQDIANVHFIPVVFTDSLEGKINRYSLIDSLQFPCHKKKYFEDVNSCLSSYFTKINKEKELVSLKNELYKIFRNNLDKIKAKIRDYRKKIEEVENCERYKINGELLKANLSLVKRGDKCITLINYFSPTQDYITIPLDDKLSALQNAQGYFKKYRKAKDSYQKIFQFLQDSQITYNELDQLWSQFLLKDKAFPELIKIKNQLARWGYIKKIKTKNTKKKKGFLSPVKYLSKDGWHIFVGKNSKQNDFLTLKLASGNDIWLHVKNLNGSHVIIKNKGTGITPPLDTLIEAANLAVYYSKAKNEKKVQVDYTAKKYVRKPKNAKPGMVIYSQEKSLFIGLDLKIINNILNRKIS